MMRVGGVLERGWSRWFGAPEICIIVGVVGKHFKNGEVRMVLLVS